ncbi:DUF423 domain-containing protein [Galbibacter mesophilus]|uniref:DUF423 domain-containing protein n=1 Tax=Galbibacter mesophilus TaxID=379069 RepID=UPI00191FE51A|nr:DUF423 domain-containing protein [Galbibacter mesophilus]MCM5663999.1 DUF423 domain-containing protein [Galbibacter mesophilus]
MKKWNFKIKSNPKELGEKIESSLNSVNGLVFNLDCDKNDSINFKIRKRILYPWHLFFLNSLVVNGKLSKTKIENESNVEISFNQHFLWVAVILADMILGLSLLIVVVSGKDNNVYTYLIGTLILAIGVILWIRTQRKYEQNIQEYKILISQVLGVQKTFANNV